MASSDKYTYSLDPQWPTGNDVNQYVNVTTTIDAFNAMLPVHTAGAMYVDGVNNAVYVSDGTSWNRLVGVAEVSAQLGCVLTDDTLAAMEASDQEEEARLRRMLLDLRAKLDE